MTTCTITNEGPPPISRGRSVTSEVRLLADQNPGQWVQQDRGTVTKARAYSQYLRTKGYQATTRGTIIWVMR